MSLKELLKMTKTEKHSTEFKTKIHASLQTLFQAFYVWTKIIFLLL